MNTRKQGLVLPERIGRYDVDGLLGKGGQGVVLLARDRELDRDVALKLLKPSETDENAMLAREARIVSQLQHPNIVSLHDVGTYNRMHYLVFEYIDGETLAARIKDQNKLTPAESVIMMSQILGGVAYLHENDIVHRDLSPSNIMISKDGIPKVTDFGLSVLKQVRQSPDEVSGTLRYMAPEPFAHLPSGPYSDVFTLGSILFEMLNGMPLFDAIAPHTIINEIVDGIPIDIRAHGIEVDPLVANVLTKASQRKIAERYPDARAMKLALDKYRIPRSDNNGGAPEKHSTVDFLMRRMSFKQGFSSLSQHVSELLKITSDDSVAPAERIVNIIAKDITLTQRILTMANSAYYGNAEINALARAVVLLGIDQVRMCITAALMENEFELGVPELREAMLKSFHSAIFAKAMARPCGIRNGADAFTCAMFHDLGRTLTIHYLHDEFSAIIERTKQSHSDELTASRVILGVAYHELGIRVGTNWKFAETIIESMRPLPRGVVEKPHTDNERLQIYTAYSNEVSQIVMQYEDPETCNMALDHLNERVADAFTSSSEDFNDALMEAAELTQQYARLIKINPDESECAKRLLAMTPLAGAA